MVKGLTKRQRDAFLVVKRNGGARLGKIAEALGVSRNSAWGLAENCVRRGALRKVKAPPEKRLGRRSWIYIANAHVQDIEPCGICVHCGESVDGNLLECKRCYLRRFRNGVYPDCGHARFRSRPCPYCASGAMPVERWKPDA